MRVIALEGVNSCGKSSIGSLIVRVLSAANHSTILIDPAGFGPVGRVLRGQIVNPSFQASADLDALLFGALRAEGAQMLKDANCSEVSASSTIVLERWALALSAYGAADLARPQLIAELRRVLLSILNVDLTVLLDITGDLALRRMVQIGNHNRFELRGAQYLDEVAHWYRHFARREERTYVIDASGDVQQTFEQVCVLLDSHGWQVHLPNSDPGT